MFTFYIRRKTGYLSPYSLRMLYGAARLAPRKYSRPETPVYIQWGKRGKMHRFPVALSRPFNVYTPGEFKDGSPLPRGIKYLDALVWPWAIVALVLAFAGAWVEGSF